jgi:hypothetical protein
MLAGLRLGLALLAGLIGQRPYGWRVPRFSLSAAILLVVVLFVFVIPSASSAVRGSPAASGDCLRPAPNGASSSRLPSCSSQR